MYSSLSGQTTQLFTLLVVVQKNRGKANETRKKTNERVFKSTLYSSKLQFKYIHIYSI